MVPLTIRGAMMTMETMIAASSSSSSSKQQQQRQRQQRASTCAHTTRQVVAQVVALTLPSKGVRLVSATRAEAGAAVAPIAAKVGHVAAVVGLRRDLAGDGGQESEQE